MAARGNAASEQRTTIGNITLDHQRLRLLVDGRAVDLRPQAFEVLSILIENSDQLVSRQHLLDEVWGTKVVTDDSLVQCLVDIRRALSDADRQIVLTVPGRGYILQSHLIANGRAGDRPSGYFLQAGIAVGIVSLIVAGFLVNGFWRAGITPERAQVATPVAAAPNATLPPDDLGAGHPFAGALVTQARSMMLLSSVGNNAEALGMLRRALDIDPDNIAALVALAEATRQSGGRAGSGDFRPAWQRSIELTNRALALDPNNPVAIAQKGWAELYYYQDYSAAARSFEQAIQIDASHPDVIRLASNAMLVLDRPDLGMRLGLEAVERDPLCVVCYMFLSLTAQFSGDPLLAENAARQVLEFRPDYQPAYERLGDVLLSNGEAEAALNFFEMRTDEHPGLIMSKAIAHYELGNLQEFARLRQRLIDEYGGLKPSAIAQLEAVSGNVDAAFIWLDKHLAQPKWIRGVNYHSPFYDNLRHDARWQEYRRRIGLSREQLASIDFNPAIPY